ncbi:hypothetical protein [Streptomyces paradoxus]|uniref:hypothetical protein n=1 Tax=Streptomyces paradoxus TaxID=66375 RepID=UPI0037D628D3
MEQREVMQRVVGVLTEAMERRRRAAEDPDAAVPSTGVVGALLTELMPTLHFPPGASAAEVAAVVEREIPPVIESMAGAFALAFVTLAETLDEDNEVTPQVLRSLALHFEEDGE